MGAMTDREPPSSSANPASSPHDLGQKSTSDGSEVSEVSASLGEKPADTSTDPSVETSTSWWLPYRKPSLTAVFVGLTPAFIMLLLNLVALTASDGDVSEVEVVIEPLLLTTVSVMIAWIPFLLVVFYLARWKFRGLVHLYDFRFSGEDWWRGLGLGLVGQLVVIVLYMPLVLLMPDVADSISEPARQLTEGIVGWKLLVLALVLCVGTPLVEELFFRGVLYKATVFRMRLPWVILVNGVVFGFVHFQPLQAVGLIAFGCLLAWRRHRSGRLAECIVAHGVFNGFSVASLALAGVLTF